jgi:hypothetical protein
MARIEPVRITEKTPESPRFQSWDERRRYSVPSSEGAWSNLFCFSDYLIFYNKLIKWNYSYHFVFCPVIAERYGEIKWKNGSSSG